MDLGIVEIANSPQGGWPQISRLNPAVREKTLIRHDVKITPCTLLKICVCVNQSSTSLSFLSNPHRGFHPKNLSRAVEDSATVTGCLVPWNSGGAYQSATLND